MSSENKDVASLNCNCTAVFVIATAFRKCRRALPLCVFFLMLTTVVFSFWSPVEAAENLTLRKGISFVTDTDTGFPIIADKMNDMTIAAGKPNVIFFGASGDLNTNRQAKRIVSVYDRYKSKDVKFIIVDIDHPDKEQTRNLIKDFYRGYIPSQVVLDSAGKKSWEMTGEVSDKVICKEIDRDLKSDSDVVESPVVQKNSTEEKR